MSDHLTLSIVIPAFNEEKYIGSCLRHILANKGPEVVEIIVIDNASTDNTRAVAEKFEGVKVITEPKAGVSFARQRGFEESKGDIIAFLDADTEMPANWTTKLLKFFQRDEKMGFVSGPYYYYDLNWYEKMICYVLGPIFYVGSVFFGPMGVGGNMALRGSTLTKLGGFDTSIEFYGDDTDIARRSGKVGKVAFSLRLIMPTSGRRLSGLGVFRTNMIYLINYLSVSLFNKPYHKKEYKEFR